MEPPISDIQQILFGFCSSIQVVFFTVPLNDSTYHKFHIGTQNANAFRCPNTREARPGSQTTSIVRASLETIIMILSHLHGSSEPIKFLVQFATQESDHQHSSALVIGPKCVRDCHSAARGKKRRQGDVRIGPSLVQFGLFLGHI